MKKDLRPDSAKIKTDSASNNYVGFANLPNQLYRKAVKDGFEFTLMVVGESGLGKSTLTNSLFLTDIYGAEYPGPSQRIKKTSKVEQTRITVKESGVQLNLSVVDTPGFGDEVNNDKCWDPIIEFIESQFELYLNAESRVERPCKIQDTRVHCCLYFIAPSGHGLKPLDIEFMRRLHDKVNIIPLIAKADTLTPDECHEFKREILREIELHKINIYKFPDGADDEEARANKRIRERIPFAIIGSNHVLQLNDRRVRARQYPWGICEIENEEHCDFKVLRDMLIRTHMQDLVDLTAMVHYENFRATKLSQLMSGNAKSTTSPLHQLDVERREHKNKMKRMEAEMEQVFELKVKEKISRLNDSEIELQRRHEQQKKKLEAEFAEIDLRRRDFEKEKAEFEYVYREFQDKIQTSDKKKKKNASLF
ncbi:Oidioi.mRNA.OKI2018_I69.XSR.g14143.t1.cds [Oikopleura dioica]|uniref:Septin n=1 Tax=Oikopleura dioica TaxID=34765 RepID=A0ABN7SE63_OIKDI|nr:Oidioi.mRNA.OKI2018_I69.XSR.g14143.t1.cds [Oikopleura dioica]